tara:strand:- start:466 stop:642 length:177 start_codon:yes stop_codon:yes gene_type:complete
MVSNLKLSCIAWKENQHFQLDRDLPQDEQDQYPHFSATTGVAICPTEPSDKQGGLDTL